MKYIIALFIALLLSGFKNNVESGHMESFGKIHSGYSKKQVIAEVGPPSVVSDFENKWYYINSVLIKSIFGIQKQVSIRIMEVYFDKENKIHQINNINHPAKKLAAINPDSSTIKSFTLTEKIIHSFKSLRPSL